MHRVPMGRKFGGPEIALIAVALAFAVPMTAWWHGLYQEQIQSPRIFPCAAAHGVPSIICGKENILSAVGYLIEADGKVSTIALPSFGGGIEALLNARAAAPDTDPNQPLLLMVASLGMIVAGVYTTTVYPALRR